MSGARGFEFLDEVTSDLTFEAHGATPGELFAAAAEALLAATVERPESVRESVARRVELEDERLDWLLRRFLSELVYLRDAEGLLLRPRAVEVGGERALRLRAELAGESFDRGRHVPGNEVKAVTAYGMFARRDPDGVWRARVTLDV